MTIQPSLRTEKAHRVRPHLSPTDRHCPLSSYQPMGCCTNVSSVEVGGHTVKSNILYHFAKEIIPLQCRVYIRRSEMTDAEHISLSLSCIYLPSCNERLVHGTCAALPDWSRSCDLLWKIKSGKRFKGDLEQRTASFEEN